MRRVTVLTLGPVLIVGVLLELSNTAKSFLVP